MTKLIIHYLIHNMRSNKIHKNVYRKDPELTVYIYFLYHNVISFISLYSISLGDIYVNQKYNINSMKPICYTTVVVFLFIYNGKKGNTWKYY